MSAPRNFGQLEPSEWAQLQTLVDSFEEARRDADTLDFDRFLPPPGAPLRPVVLQELVKSDLEIRWRRGQATALEYYLARYPELGRADAVPAQLVYEEYRVRQLFGDQPALGSYRARFPGQFAAFERLLQERPVIAPKGSAPTPTGPNSSAGPGVLRNEAVLPVGGGYQLVRRIGSGSFAEVWAAKAPGGIDVAIKSILQPIDKEEAQRELQALELTKQLRHAFLLQTHAYYLLDERVYVVYELADGSLRDRLRRCRQDGLTGVPLAELFGYFLEAAEAIDFLHKNPIQKVVHRDIKPENVLLLQGHAKVADFGLARVLHSQRISVSGGAGTPRYMAPEVWDSKVHKVGERSDLYSLALTYAELRQGRPPFAQQDLPSLMLAHLKDPPDLGGLPEAEQRVLLKALAKDPNDRHASCMEFVRELKKAVLPELRKSHPELYPSEPPALASASTADSDQFATLVGPVPSATSGVAAWHGSKTGSVGSTVVEAARGRGLAGFLLGIALVAVVAGVLVRVFWPPPPPPELTAPATLAVEAGKTTTITVVLKGFTGNGPPPLRFQGQPPGVVFTQLSGGTDPGRAEVKVVAAPDAPPRTATVTVTASRGETSAKAEVELVVKPGKFALPAGWRPAPGSGLWEADDRAAYYERLEVCKDDLRVPFVLIKPNEQKKRVAPFYIMVDKVSVREYSRFTQFPEGCAALGSGPLGPLAMLAWFSGPHREDYPVMRVPVEVSHLYAEWLAGPGRGFLPTVEQWDLASGRYEQNPGQGPFTGEWDEEQPGLLDLAIKWARRVPMKCGEAQDDRSRPYGLHDMAANGWEWTRNAESGARKELVPVQKNPHVFRVWLRGGSFAGPRPLLFADALDQEPDMQMYSSAASHVGFRVVIEFGQ